jgi:hypothetical protein
MVAAIRVKSPFSHNALLGLTACVLFVVLFWTLLMGVPRLERGGTLPQKLRAGY